MKLFLAVLPLILLVGCTGSITDTSCQSYKPISWSKRDTTQTKRQVVAHNKVYDVLCP